MMTCEHDRSLTGPDWPFSLALPLVFRLQDRAGNPGSSWVTMPEHFKKAGFTTLGGGKTFHPGQPKNWVSLCSTCCPAQRCSWPTLAFCAPPSHPRTPAFLQGRWASYLRTSLAGRANFMVTRQKLLPVFIFYQQRYQHQQPLPRPRGEPQVGGGLAHRHMVSPCDQR